MSIGQRRFGYRAAVDGDAPPAPKALLQRTKAVPHRSEILAEAVGMLRAARCRDPEFLQSDVSAWEFLNGVVEDLPVSRERREELHLDLMRIAVYRARRDPSYWGVEDPEQERYCYSCDSVRPVEAFPDDSYTCRACT